MTTSYDAELRPRWIAVAVPVTMPLVAERWWVALMSTPTDNRSGMAWRPEPIEPSRLRLVRAAVPPADRSPDQLPDDAAPRAYRSSLTITFDDGRVLSGVDAIEYARGCRT